jgi:hypothetical protein
MPDAVLVKPAVNAGHAEEVISAIVVNDLFGRAVDDDEAIGWGGRNVWIRHGD